ncbi:hypothetical protein [Streptomyces sp. NPDC002644]
MPEENENDKPNEPGKDEGPKTLEEALAALAAAKEDVTKWKGLSRQNEQNYNAARTELTSLKEAQMTDAEKAIEQAKQEARKAALSEVGADLLNAELALQATTAGVTLPASQFINTSALLGEDGRPNKEAVTTFIGSLPKAEASQEFPEIQGAGRQSGGAPDMTASMDPNELADYISDGSFL